MSRTVFILGAGASEEVGVPLMEGFLNRAEDIQQSLDDERLKKLYQQVFNAVADLRTVHDKCRLDTNNIEEILSTFEMARILGRLGKMTETEILSTYGIIKEFVSSVIERSTAYLKDDKSKTYWPLGPLLNFAALIKNMEDSEARQYKRGYTRRTSIITFNYDTALENAFRAQQIEYDYCLEGNTSPNRIPVLKLHGSINWGTCGKEGCEKIAANVVYHHAIHQDGNRHYFSGNPEKAVHCNQETGNPVPAIVPPTWYKTQPSSSIVNVWQNAIMELSDAKEIIVIGYSLPPSDNFFKYLFAIGTNTDSRVRKFCVCNPSQEVIERFRKLVGVSIESGFTPLEMKFGKFINSDSRNFLLR